MYAILGKTLSNLNTSSPISYGKFSPSQVKRLLYSNWNVIGIYNIVVNY